MSFGVQPTFFNYRRFRYVFLAVLTCFFDRHRTRASTSPPSMRPLAQIQCRHKILKKYIQRSFNEAAFIASTTSAVRCRRQAFAKKSKRQQSAAVTKTKTTPSLRLWATFSSESSESSDRVFNTSRGYQDYGCKSVRRRPSSPITKETEKVTLFSVPKVVETQSQFKPT